MNDAVKPDANDDIRKLPLFLLREMLVAGDLSPEDYTAESVRRSHQYSAALTAPAQPVGVPEGWRLIPEKPTIEMVKKAHKDHEGEPWLPYSLWESMLSAAPQPPAEGGWKPPPAGWIRPSAAAALREGFAGRTDINEQKTEIFTVPVYLDVAPLPPAPANGGE